MRHIEERMRKKSFQGHSKTRVVGVGVSRKGNILTIGINTPTRNQYENPYSHVEYKILSTFGRKVHTILIARFGRSGKKLPIEPCARCQDFADRLGVIIKEI